MKRRTSLATLGGAALLVATSLTLGSQPAIAADHGDGGATLDANGAADIADLYAWTESGSTTLTLIMTVTGTVSSDIQYAFHVGRQDTASNAALAPSSEVTDIICTIGMDASDTTCWVGDPNDGGDYVTGDASGAAGVSSDSGTTTVHIGTHADPFFFFADGFTAAITAVNDFAADDIMGNLNLNGTGYPERLDDINSDVDAGTDCDQATTSSFADVLGQLLVGDWTYSSMNNQCTVEAASVAANNFAGQNVDAIVIEVDTSLLAGNTDNVFLQVWGSTHDGM
jgi:hypothetical protein